MKCSLKYVMFGIIISGLVISPAAARRLFQRHCCKKKCAQKCAQTCTLPDLETPCPPTCEPTPCEPVDCAPIDCVPVVDGASPEIAEDPPAPQDITIAPAPLVEVPHTPVAPAISEEASEELVAPESTSEAALAPAPVEPVEQLPVVAQPNVQPEPTDPHETTIEEPIVDSSITPTAEVEPASPNVVGDRYATEPITPPVSTAPAPVETMAVEPASNDSLSPSASTSDSSEELFEDPIPFLEKELATEAVEAASDQEPTTTETPDAIFGPPSESDSEANLREESNLQDEIDTEKLFGPSSPKPQETASLEESPSEKKPAAPVEKPNNTGQPEQSLPVFQSPKSIESPASQPKSQTAADQEDVDSVFGPSPVSSAEASPAQPAEKSKEIKQPEKSKQPEPKTPAKDESEESYDPFGEDIFSQNEQTTILSAPGGLYSSIERTWTDETATHECQARLVRVTSNRVILERATGAKLAVPFARMADGDLHFVREQLTALRIVQTRQADAEKLASVTNR